jgi:pilus assembly protein Flp/PilA
MFLKALVALQTFRKEEDGLALTEYLVLLGLLTAAVIAAVTLLGTNIGLAFTDWAGWITTNLGAP